MPTFRLEDEQGRWRVNMQLNAPASEPRRPDPARRRDTLEVVEVRYDQEPVTLVVKGTAARATSAAAVLGIRNCRLAQAPGC